MTFQLCVSFSNGTIVLKMKIILSLNIPAICVLFTQTIFFIINMFKV